MVNVENWSIRVRFVGQWVESRLGASALFVALPFLFRIVLWNARWNLLHFITRLTVTHFTLHVAIQSQLNSVANKNKCNKFSFVLWLFLNVYTLRTWKYLCFEGIITSQCHKKTFFSAKICQMSKLTFLSLVKCHFFKITEIKIKNLCNLIRKSC